MPEASGKQPCPYCKARMIEAIATLPSVRPADDRISARFATRSIAGCKLCVRKQLLIETLRSGVEGWGSLGSAAANPVLILYGLARAGFVRNEPERVTRMLEAAGVAEAPVKPVRIAYALAAALIRADGRVDYGEIDIASSIGKQVFADFNDADFLATVAANNDLPSPDDLAHVLNGIVDHKTKNAVYRFLVAIAAADNKVVAEERTMLRSVAENLGLEQAGSGVDRSV